MPLLRSWTTAVKILPAEALAARRFFHPVVGNLEALRDTGMTRTTDENDKGEGFSVALKLSGDGFLEAELSCYPEGITGDYGAEQLARAIGAILADEDPGTLHFNSGVR